MASVAIKHYTNKINSDGTSPVIIEVISNRSAKRRTLANVFESQWDQNKKRVIPKKHPNYAAINLRISSEYNRIEELIISGAFNLTRDFIEYFDRIKKGEPEHEPVSNSLLSFAAIIPLYIASLNSGQSRIAYRPKLLNFVEESGLGNLPTSQISKEHIDRFVKYLQARGNSNTTIRTRLKIVRYASSFAEKKGLDAKSKALHDYQLPANSGNIKQKLTMDEFKLFTSFDYKERVTVKGNRYSTREAQDMFALAVYLRGMRIADIIQLRQDSIKNGRLVYHSQKTNRLFNIKLVDDAIKIVDRYRDGREYLFTYYKWQENLSLAKEENIESQAVEIKRLTAVVNKRLKEVAKAAGIRKPVSTHIARHTFSLMAIKKAGGDLNLSMDLVGHNDIKVHQEYIRQLTMDEDLDAAADDIFK